MTTAERPAGRYIQGVPLFWLNYRDLAGRAAGVAVVQAPLIMQARMTASVYGFDRCLDFASGHELDDESAR